MKALDNTPIYARPVGIAYHLTLTCPMLAGGQYKTYGYTLITKRDIKKRHLVPCLLCAFKGGRK